MSKHKPTIREKFVTPAGVSTYVWLDKPDSSPQGKNKFKCGLILDKGVEANDALAKKLNDLHKSVKGKRDKAPVKDGDVMAEDNAEKYERLRGKWLLVAKSKDAVKVVDSARKPCANARSGDLVKLAIYCQDYNTDGSTGVSLYLNAVQLLERRNMGADATSMFDDESDTFAADSERADENGFADESNNSTEGDDDGDY